MPKLKYIPLTPISKSLQPSASGLVKEKRKKKREGFSADNNLIQVERRRKRRSLITNLQAPLLRVVFADLTRLLLAYSSV